MKIDQSGLKPDKDNANEVVEKLNNLIKRMEERIGTESNDNSVSKHERPKLFPIKSFPILNKHNWYLELEKRVRDIEKGGRVAGTY